SQLWTKKLKSVTGLRVMLIAPCKVIDADLRSNLLSLFWQRYPTYELCFVVESESEPAVSLIRELQGENPQIPCQLVVAGIARDCGQKVHNLMCASRTVCSRGTPCATAAAPAANSHAVSG